MAKLCFFDLFYQIKETSITPNKEFAYFVYYVPELPTNEI